MALGHASGRVIESEYVAHDVGKFGQNGSSALPELVAYDRPAVVRLKFLH
jgi:hypothetical protein